MDISLKNFDLQIQQIATFRDYTAVAIIGQIW